MAYVSVITIELYEHQMFSLYVNAMYPYLMLWICLDVKCSESIFKWGIVKSVVPARSEAKDVHIHVCHQN